MTLYIIWEEGLVSGEVIEIIITRVDRPYRLDPKGITDPKKRRRNSATVVKRFELRDVVERSLRSDFMEETLERITGCQSELVIRRGTVGNRVILPNRGAVRAVLW
jgi:hypothetical protein